jgi:hypothetical protein
MMYRKRGSVAPSQLIETSGDAIRCPGASLVVARRESRGAHFEPCFCDLSVLYLIDRKHVDFTSAFGKRARDYLMVHYHVIDHTAL